MDDKQLNVVGHGENRPIFSNNTYEGKQRNRRVELVIYPDQRPGR
jgi:outer membrane protein OmpA-like peptidoglycan-associated protein